MRRTVPPALLSAVRSLDQRWNRNGKDALGIGVLTVLGTLEGPFPLQARLAGCAIGVIACALFLARRRHPVLITLAGVCAFTVSAASAALGLTVYVLIRCRLWWPLAILLPLPYLAYWLANAGGVPLPYGMPAGTVVGSLAMTFFPVATAIAVNGYEQSVQHYRELALTERRNREQREELLRAAHRERMLRARGAIAQTVHDGVGHRISVMCLKAGAVELRVQDNERAAQLCMEIADTGAEAMRELKTALDLLREDDPDHMDDETGNAATGQQEPEPGLNRLTALVDEYRRYGQPVSLRLAVDSPLIPAHAQELACRVVREALMNCLRHAYGARTAVSVWYEDGALRVRIANDAPTPDSPTPAHARPLAGTGHGLATLRAAVTEAGGTLDAKAQTDGGFATWASLPCEPATLDDTGPAESGQAVHLGGSTPI
ncbi:sensor histidine kinase [Streptomyces fractus]|uniref:sensor histidine kinase n=1 Tax=Streptomyces fractus TaxID=641806 RepID=UPI003CEA00C1